MGRGGIVRVNGVNAKQRPWKIRAKCLVGVTEAGTDGALCPGVPVLEVLTVGCRYQEPYLFALSSISSTRSFTWTLEDKGAQEG